MKKQFTKNLTILAVSVLCSATILTGCATDETTPDTTIESEANNEETTGEDSATTDETPEQTSPMGGRKMVDINGSRFVFINNAEPIDAQYFQIGDQINTLENGIFYKLGNYDPAFRQVYKYEDQFYVVENMANSDDSPIDVKAYLETANLEETVMFADIFNHMGDQILKNIDAEASKQILAAFKEGKVATLENADYEAIAAAQSEEKSYRVVFTLEDNTSFTSYVIPSMNYFTIGDYTCTLDGLNEKIGGLFENLEASEPIIMN